MSKREAKFSTNPLARAGIISVALSILMVIVFASLGGVLILKEVLPESLTKVWAVLAVFLAAFLGPMPLLRASGKKKLPMAYAVLGALVAALLLGKWLAWPGGNFTNWWVLLGGFLGATLAGVLRAQKPKHKKR